MGQCSWPLGQRVGEMLKDGGSAVEGLEQTIADTDRKVSPFKFGSCCDRRCL